LDFGHLALFSISGLGFRVWFSEVATPSARNDILPGNPEQIQKLNIKNQNYNSKIKKLLF